MSLSRASSAARYAGAFLVAFALLLALPSQAQTVTTFISNTGQTTNLASADVQAVAFTTGTGTYTLSSVGIFVGAQNGTPTPVVQVYGDSGGNPGTTLVATMTNPGTITDNAVNTFTAPANTTLSASTIYWVVTSNSAATNGTGFRVGLTNTTLDSGTAAGWSLGNARSKSDIAAISWTASSSPLRFDIRGTNAGICSRTQAVRDAILAKIPGISDCGDVTNNHLGAITGMLDLSSSSISALAAGDFDGLTSLTDLNLERNDLATLPAGIFDGLTSLTDLNLEVLATLPAGIFDGLTSLTDLNLERTSWPRFPPGYSTV